MKTSLFDRIFKAKTIRLENGHTVDKPVNRMPFILVTLVVVVYISAKMTNFDFSLLVSRISEFTVILSKIFQPNFNYFSHVMTPLVETIQMSVAGTIFGCLIGLPLAILSSSNINKNRPSLLVFRFILSVLRSVPALIYASIFALVFSLGTLAGTVAIIVFTVGIVAKMLYESIETIDMGPYEAMISMGASTFKSFWTACMPQILPTYIDDCLYCFELNVRASSILGYVGAGGLGILIRERTGFRAYSDLGMILLSVFIVVWLIDFVNNMIRKKLS
ncbi:phosphonate ABC transporter, permease protein PhnE [Bulleidia sp. zg-1006]|uniref:phosphonate ABC transporter, permease protein PhnE n=1 Tax=Bulleidia sp. zg-1006 TaxID=2806552 RepID=UPI001939ABD1|nr:phosphonate ABC transporter, permease protein PhnE [Bulleidia sp. zg-1006]QRG86729.1 phosphonate ABC transporter, permease protein PhnE [Bulleidia sp. zg-1006]